MPQENDVISVMSTLAVEVAFRRWIVPTFEAETRYRLAISWDPTTVLMRRILAGERADVVVAIDDAIDELTEAGVTRSETRIPIAKAQLGLAVRSGAPRPDISTVAAFVQALIEAESIVYSRGGASGIYFGELIKRLGLSDIVMPKAITIPAGFTAERVAAGDAQLAVQQISELMTIDGIDVVGPFPDALQVTTGFSAAAFADAENHAGALHFLKTLRSERAQCAYRNGGLVST